MSSVLEIKSTLEKLSRSDFANFRDWILDFDAEAWDQ